MVESDHRQVVQKHERLGALHHEIVDHHRDTVDTHCVEAAQLGGELELGTHAVCACHEDGILVSLWSLEEPRETTDG